MKEWHKYMRASDGGNEMALIRYVATGRQQRQVNVAYSMNHGKSWQRKELVPGQSFPIPPNCTSLLIDNVPYDPSGNYEIREGQVAVK